MVQAGRRYGWVVMLVAAMVMAIPMTIVLSTSSFAADDSQEKDADKAAKEAHQGWDEMSKVDKKLTEGKAKDAVAHFNTAVKHFSKAVDYFADSMLSDAQKDGVAKLDKGAKELDKAAKDLDKGNINDAQEHYDSAVELIADGMDMLGA